MEHILLLILLAIELYEAVRLMTAPTMVMRKLLAQRLDITWLLPSSMSIAVLL